MYLAPKRSFSFFAICILVVCTLLGTYQPVQAGNTLTVEIFTDEYSGVMWGEGCGLREAIQAAYLNQTFGGCEADSNTDTIYLPAGEYHLIIQGASEDAGATGDLDIRENIAIIGAGAEVTKIIAGGETFGDRVFHILGGSGSPTLRLSGLEISGGWAADGGSGILNQGATLNTDGVVISGNGNLNRTGGGISNKSGGVLFVTNTTISGNTGSYGGGIYNTGAVTVVDSTITDNTANIDGGGLASLLEDANIGFTQIRHSTFSLNHVNRPVQGAGISSNGRLTMEDSVVENNTGIGLLINPGSSAVINGSQFNGNTSTNPLNGAGVDNSGTLSMQGSQVLANTGTGMVMKGATASLLKTNITQNIGIGLLVNSGSTMQISSSNVTENTPANPSAGAGIASAGTLTVNYSAIAKNAGPGLLVTGGTAALTNSTVGANNRLVEPGVPDTANSVGIASSGGLTVNNSTIADHAGVGVRVDGGSILAGASLFARNTGANCTMAASAVFNSQSKLNLRDRADDAGASPCTFNESINLVGDPMLDSEMKNNGGFTQTYALLNQESPNPAVDAIDKTNPLCPAVDQRMFGRPVDGNIDGDKDCDIGAYELGASGYSIYLPAVRR